MLSRLGKYSGWVPLILRVALGAAMVGHGYGKLFGGVEGFAGALTSLGVIAPLAFAWAVSLLEFFGSIALIAGVFVRYVSAALVLMFTYIVASSVFLHKPIQTFLGGGDYALLILGVSVALVILGSGKLSLERMILKKEL